MTHSIYEFSKELSFADGTLSAKQITLSSPLHSANALLNILVVDFPIVTDLFQQLEREGFDMGGDYPLTIDEAKEKFLELLNKN